MRIVLDRKKLPKKYVEEPEKALEEAPELRILERVARLIRRGYIVTYPTDTVYGLGARIYDREAVERIYEIKRRPKEKPVLIAVRSRREIEKYAYVGEKAREFILSHLPGPYSVVLRARSSIPPRISRGSIGIRVPNCVVSTLLAYFAGPIVSTSANISGGKPPKSVREALLGDIVIDIGELPGRPSEIYDFTSEEIRRLRRWTKLSSFVSCL